MKNLNEFFGAQKFYKVTGTALVSSILALSALSPTYSYAQQQGGAQYQAPVVQQIVVRGNKRIEAGTIQSYVPVKPGQRVNQQALDVVIKTLFGTGLFADVNVGMQQGVMIVDVQENPIVNRVLYEGNKRIKEEKFLEEVKLAPRSVYTKAKVQADAQRILDMYRAKGRFAAAVTPKYVELPQNRVDIIFEIVEGPKTGIAKINFSGNEAFTSHELRNSILTHESRWWKLMKAQDSYDPDKLEYDRELLREHYTKNGYADFQVVSAVAELTPDREDFFINFDVEEGIQYKFGKINVKSNLSKMNSQFIKSTLPVREGEIFNSELIEKAEEAITYTTGISGYAFVDIRPRFSRNKEAQTIDITFEINEGPRVYVERINVVGNTRTLDRVIRREMRLAEGDAFNRVLVDRSKQRVTSLGHFSEVEIEESAGSSPDRTVLDVAVTEQSTGSFSVGAGISSTDRFIANFSIEQRNLLGKGQYLQFDAQLSNRTRNVTIRFREPYFMDRNLNAGFDLFNNRIDYKEAGYVRDTLGAGINAGFPVSERGRLALNYSLRNDEVIVEGQSSEIVTGSVAPTSVVVPGASFTTDTTAFAPDTLVTASTCDFISRSLDPTCESRGEFLTSSLGYTFSYDTRNHPIVPTRGYNFSIGQNFAGLGGDVKYLKTQINAAFYRQLPYDFVGSLKFSGGAVQGWGDDTVRLNDRFFKGGSSFRGFKVAGIGPRLVYDDALNRRDQAIGANVFAVGTAEVLLPLPIPDDMGIRASLFTDFGTVGLVDDNVKDPLNNDLSRWVDFNNDGIPDSPVQDDTSLRVSAGVSINWKSPFGPVRLDFSEALLHEDYDETEAFRFSAGTNF